MVLPDVEAAVTAMVMRWQRELLVVQQQYGFDQVDDTMRRLEEQVDAVGGKARAVVDERGLVGGSRDADWETGAGSQMVSGAVEGLSMALVRCSMRVLVARWREVVLAARERAVVPSGDLKMTKKMRRELRARAMALARLIGCVQLVVARLWMYRCAMSNWGIAVFNCRSVRAEALVAAVVPADESLCRRVWLRLVGSFAECTVSSLVVEQVAGVGEKVERSWGGIGAYDWTCTQCGWGGRLVRAGHSTCNKCEWQCLRQLV